MEGETMHLHESNSMTRSEDTIAAIVTPVVPGQGSVSIVRLSGDSATSIANNIFKRPRGAAVDLAALPSHTMQFGTIVSPSSGEVLDEVLCVPMLSPKSYTAEDVVEINCHGGSVCGQRVLRACINQGARFAQPGEFTLRAFLNGRIDLAQAESVQSLISARTQEAASSALDSLRGGLSSEVQRARAEVNDLIAELDARLDFDEELPHLDVDDIARRISSLERELDRVISTAERGRLMETGITVALVGKPNAGKSSLLNAWTRSERAIVTEVPGTTRDVVEASVSVGGIAVNLLDTAGIREDPSDAVETIGVERSRSAASGADVILMLADASTGWDGDDDDVLHRVIQHEQGAPALLVMNKADIALQLSSPASAERENSEHRISKLSAHESHVCGPEDLITEAHAQNTYLGQNLPSHVHQAFDGRIVFASALAGKGIDTVENELLRCCDVQNIQVEGSGWAVNQRQAEALIRARDALKRLQGTIEECLPTDFWTIELREAALAIGQVTGDDVTEDVLDVIFSRFCIGK